VLWAAQRSGIPTLIQEQNSYAGLTNKILAHGARRICVAYDGMERFFPAERIVHTGNPLRGRFAVPTEADRLEEWAEKQERLDALNRAVERLDPEERALVTLFYYEDRSVGECAAITELSEGNVKVRLHRIRKKLYVLVNDEMNGTE